MLTDDTNFFCSDENINNLFKTANEGLNEINEKTRANKPSINEGKAKNIYSCKLQNNDIIPLKLPIFILRNIELKRVNPIKFSGVIIDEHIN